MTGRNFRRIRPKPGMRPLNLHSAFKAKTLYLDLGTYGKQNWDKTKLDKKNL